MEIQAYTKEKEFGQSVQQPVILSEKLDKKKSLDLDVVIPSDNHERDTVRMERSIGLLGAVALILGTMIGSGIFISPIGLLKNTGSTSLSLVVWAACGFLATLAALSYGELGTIIPRSGGEHAYFMATFGPMSRFFGQLPAFLYYWVVSLLLRPSAIAIVSMAFGKYSLSPILKMEPFCKQFQEKDDFKLAVNLLAVVVASLIAGINIISAKFATRAAIVFLVAKISIMAIMIGIGIYNLVRGEFGDLAGGWDPTEKTAGDIALSFYSGLWAYDGWNNLNFVTEELINPYRNLPLAIIIGIPSCTVLYILINLAYLTALTKQEMLDSEAVAVDVGDKYLGPVKLVIPILVAIAAVGTGNGNMFSAGRVAYVAGRDGLTLDVMSYVHAKRLTPVVSIIVNLAIAYVFIFASEIDKLIELVGFAAWIFYGLSIACVIILRFTQPDAPRPFKVPIVIPIIATAMSAVLVVLPIAYDPKIDYLGVAGFFVLGVLVYTVFVYKKYRLPYMDEITRFIQHVTLAVPSPYKED